MDGWMEDGRMDGWLVGWVDGYSKAELSKLSFCENKL